MKNKTKAQKLFERWAYLNSRPNFGNVGQEKLDTQEWKKIDEELKTYLLKLVFQGKLFSINTNGHLCSVNMETKNTQRSFVRIDDYVFAEMEIVNNALKPKGE